MGESLGGIAGTTISGVIMPADIDDMTAHAADANSTADGNDSCYIVNIGDSRTYHMCAAEDGGWDASTFTRITRDHSERQNAIDSGEMLPEEALRNIPRNIITQCIGAPNGIAPDYYAADAFGRFIICSDACMPKWTRNVSQPSRPPTTILRPPPTRWSKRRCGPVATTT